MSVSPKIGWRLIGKERVRAASRSLKSKRKLESKEGRRGNGKGYEAFNSFNRLGAIVDDSTALILWEPG